MLRSAWGLLRDSGRVLLEAAPEGLEVEEIGQALAGHPHVASVHDLHVWAVTPRMVAMSAHAICRDSNAQQHALEHVHDAMRLFGIQHITVQLEKSEMHEREEHLHA